ncbi:MAG: glycosyltransferase [Myxococcota bacterium]
MSPSPDLSLVIPAYEEALRLRPTLDAVLAWLDREHVDGEVVVVDDGSADRTPEIVAETAAADPRVVPITLPRNRGKGRAVATGVESARGRWIVFFDADLSYPLDHVHEALERLKGGAEAVFGSRLAHPECRRDDYPPMRRLASRAFGALVDGLLDLDVRDTQCGFKAFRADVAKPLFRALTIDGFGFDVELHWLVHHWGLRAEVMPVRMTHRPGGSVAPLRHGLGMAADVLRVRARSALGAYPGEPGDEQP